MAMSASGAFEYFRGLNGQWFVRERHRNGEIVMASEAYTRKDSAIKAARRRAAEKKGRWRVIESAA